MSAESNTQFGKTIWLITFVLIFFVGIFIYSAFAATPDGIKASLLNERISNVGFSAPLDEKAWAKANESSITQGLLSDISARILNSHNIVDGKKGAVESVWDNAPANLEALGLLIDYRLYVMLYLSPILLLLGFPVIVDALMVRKKGLYKNNFTSAFRHNLGGRVIALPFSYLTIGALFVPFTVPVFVFLILLGIKATGWWIWAVNLPKRI